MKPVLLFAVAGLVTLSGLSVGASRVFHMNLLELLRR